MLESEMKGDLGNYDILTTCDAVKSIKPGNMTKSLERERKEREREKFNAVFFRVEWHKWHPKFSCAIMIGF